MPGTLLRYRVLAYVVGVLLIVLTCIGVPLKYLAAAATAPQRVGEWITTYLGVAHGWLYMLYLVVAFILARKARCPLGFNLVTLGCGSIPILLFCAERCAIVR